MGVTRARRAIGPNPGASEQAKPSFHLAPSRRLHEAGSNPCISDFHRLAPTGQSREVA